jgi:hypothetical protein
VRELVRQTGNALHHEQVEVVQGGGAERDAHLTGTGRGRIGNVRQGGVVQPPDGVEDERSYGRKVGATICSVGPAGMGVGVPPPTVCR